MTSKPVSASITAFPDLCRDEISLKLLTDAVLLDCGCSYNTETAEALQSYQLPCLKHEQFVIGYRIEECLRAIVRAILQNETAFPVTQLTSDNVSDEIPEVAKSLCEKGKQLFLKQLFRESARAFLGATLHHPSYTEARSSLESALKFLPNPSSQPQLYSSALPTPGSVPYTSTPSQEKKPKSKPAAAAFSPKPAAAPPVNIKQLNTGTIVHNNHSNYAPQVTYAPVTKTKDARTVVNDSSQYTYAPHTTYAPQTTYAPINYHFSSSPTYYGAPLPSGSTAAPAPAAPKQSSPATLELPDYVKNAKTPEGKGKALIKAIDRRERAMVDYLVEQKAQLDATDAKHRTPLQAACEGNWSDVLEFLIENGAKTNGEDAISALIAATKARYGEVVKILARNNTPLLSPSHNDYPNYSYTPCEVFEAAARNGDVELIAFFLDEMQLKLETTVHYAHSRNDDALNSVSLIEVSMGENALDIACEIGNLPLVKLLLSKEAKVNKALYVATDKKNLPILRLLCSNKEALNCYSWESTSCTLNLKDQPRSYNIYKVTYSGLALIKACERGDVEAAKLLAKITNLTQDFKIDAGYNRERGGQDYLNVSLGEIAFQASSNPEIKALFPDAVRVIRRYY